MSIKSKEINKYYIEQIILDDDNNPIVWSNCSTPEATFQDIVCKRDKLIGYYFYFKKTKFGEAARILTLYLIKPRYYNNNSISLNELVEAYKKFLTLDINSKTKVFKNPPIKQWLDTKENWCKKLANKFSKQFNISFEEALSDVYYSVMKCYRKNNIYMSNLGYIETTAYNVRLMTIRYNKNRLSQSSKNCISLNTIVNETEDETITIADCIGEIDKNYNALEYSDFERDCILLLSKYFSEREIEQILTQKAGYLPHNLYKRLIAFRHKYSQSDLLNKEEEL